MFVYCVETRKLILEFFVSWYSVLFYSKKSRLRRRECRSTTRAPNNVMIKKPGEIKMFYDDV